MGKLTVNGRSVVGPANKEANNGSNNDILGEDCNPIIGMVGKEVLRTY